MAHFEEQGLPEELREVEEALRRSRPSFTALELDQFKLETIERASRRSTSRRGRMGGKTMKSRLVALGVAVLLVGGTTGGAIAGHAGGGGGDAAKAQYRPGNGCGDKNHIHTGPPGQHRGPKCPGKP